jgi:hypothetical protein
MDPTPEEQHKCSLGSGENYGTFRTYPRRLAETAEEEEIIEGIKRGDDLDQLE